MSTTHQKSGDPKLIPTTADTLVDLLVDRWGVRHIFGFPGDGINGVIESLRKRRHDVQFLQVRHEEAAAFAACAYAKFTGRLGVCLATAGPGAIHLLNGLYDAKADQAPVLALTGLQYSDVIGTHFQQDFDTTRLLGEVAPYSYTVMQPGHLDNITNLAIRYALTNRCVSHVAIPIDVQESAATSGRYAGEDQPHHTSGIWSVPRILPNEEDVKRAAAVLNSGRKIAILAGAGARGAAAELEQLAEMLAAPVGKALLGKDCLPDDSPFTTMGVAIIGSAASQGIMEECDTFLMIGTSMPYTAYYPKVGQARGVQIDINPARIGLRYPVEAAVAGDTRETIRALIPHLKRNPDRSFLVRAQEAVRRWNLAMKAQETSRAVPMRPQVFAAAISRHMDDDALICGDVGQVTHWASRHLRIRGEQKFICSGTLASMACALPYAIGAATAFPGRQVIAYAGDGSLTMLMGEIATCVKYNLPVKIFVSKNNALGLIRWEQMLFLGHPEYGIELQNVDFVKVAEACGAKAFRVDDPADVDEIVTKALSIEGPVLVEGVIDPFEPVMPGHIFDEQAKHYGEALRLGLRSGQPTEKPIALTMYRAAVELGPTDSARITEALGNSAPALLPAAKAQLDRHKAGRSDGSEPQASFDLQKSGSLERTSGKPQPAGA
jgi:pyruvate dehydrogenase (quinone)